jgi:hypothetical protein
MKRARSSTDIFSRLVSNMEQRTTTDSVPVRSTDNQPDRWYHNTTPSYIGPRSLTQTLTEYLILKRAIKIWQAPRHPTYDSLSARLQSLKNWPHREYQIAKSLSEAGFYYDGTFIFNIIKTEILTDFWKFFGNTHSISLITVWNDTTVCFHCGGGLTAWLASDDAWAEHAKWFPYCVYVRHIYGDHFVRECTRIFPKTETD